jgi:hypothetical protein
VAKILKLLVLLFWAILAIFLVPTILPLIVVTGDALTTMILVVVTIAFIIIFPIALILSKDED